MVDAGGNDVLERRNRSMLNVENATMEAMEITLDSH